MENSRINLCFWALRVGLGAAAFLPESTEWGKYIAPEASEKLPISNKNFMRIGILSPKTEVSSYAASA